MLAYICENCKRFTVMGYENGYGERFCSVICYKKYCEKNGYEYKREDIKEIKNALNT